MKKSLNGRPAAFLLIFMALFCCVSCFQPKEANLQKAEKKEKELPVQPDISIDSNIEEMPSPHLISGHIEKGSSLYACLNNAEVPHVLINRIVGSLQKVFDLRYSSPGDTYLLKYFPPDKLQTFQYSPSGRHQYLVCLEDNAFVASKVQKNLDRYVRFVSAKVSGSLWRTLVKMGEDQGLISKMASIFEWEIDFLTDVRQGDEFELIIECFKEDGRPGFDGNILIARYCLQGSDHFGILYRDAEGFNDYYDFNGNSLRKTLLKSPLNYRRISSKYSLSRLHPILKIRRPHYGVDYVAKKGTPVVAAGDGRVVYKGWKGDYGKTIILRHSHQFESYYGHLSGYAKGLSKGKRVKQGQLIGYVGSTGLSTGPHLDYRLKKNGRWVDPLKLVPPSVKPISHEYFESFCKVRDKMLSTMRYMAADNKTVIASSLQK